MIKNLSKASLGISKCTSIKVGCRTKKEDIKYDECLKYIHTVVTPRGIHCFWSEENMESSRFTKID